MRPEAYIVGLRV